MKCDNCGIHGLPEDSAFCTSCGARLATLVITASAPVTGPSETVPVFNGVSPRLPVSALQLESAGVPEAIAAPESQSAPPSNVVGQVAAHKTAPREPSERSDTPSRPAGFWRRLGARLVDGLIVLAVGLIPAIIIYYLVYEAVLPNSFATQEDIELADGSGTLAAAGFYLLFGATYAIVGWASGGTFGMRAVGLRLQPIHGGGAPGLGRAVARWLVSVISGLVLFIGYVAIVWSRDGQTWHDAAAGTIVVENR